MLGVRRMFFFVRVVYLVYFLSTHAGHSCFISFVASFVEIRLFTRNLFRRVTLNGSASNKRMNCF